MFTQNIRGIYAEFTQILRTRFEQLTRSIYAWISLLLTLLCLRMFIWFTHDIHVYAVYALFTQNLRSLRGLCLRMFIWFTHDTRTFLFTQFTHYLRIIYAVYVDFIYACLYGLRKIPAHFFFTQFTQNLRRFYAVFTQFTRTWKYLRMWKYLHSLRRIYAEFTQVYAACVNWKTCLRSLRTEHFADVHILQDTYTYIDPAISVGGGISGAAAVAHRSNSRYYLPR